MKITEIWFENNRIYIKTDGGRVLWQSLLYYPKLAEASDYERREYSVSPFGIHWERLDEDISLESFEYENPEPKGISRLLLSLPDLNLSSLARRLGIQQSLMAAYKNGTKKPSKERENLILAEIRKIGAEFLAVKM